jgi:DNA-binding response OmpR family regulator
MAYRILIVDDDKEIVSMLKERLQMEGYDTAAAYDGEEGLVKIKETDPDVILLDLMLPKLNGYEVLKAIREKFKDKWRPVIILSGKSDLESVKKGYSLEADHYLTKPCSMENILRGIRTMISLIPLRKQQ